MDVLGDAVGAVPALKRLLIFDTCQSGGAVMPRRTGRDPFAFRGEVERLSRAQGMFTLAAAAAGDLRAPPPFPTFRDGHREMLLCDAILQSHREQRWVSLREMRP